MELPLPAPTTERKTSLFDSIALFAVTPGVPTPVDLLEIVGPYAANRALKDCCGTLHSSETTHCPRALAKPGSYKHPVATAMKSTHIAFHLRVAVVVPVPTRLRA